MSSLELSKIKRQDFYSRIKNEGRYGYFRDATWDKEAKIHSCCKSKARWYHKIGCPAAREDFDLSFKKRKISELENKIKRLKHDGKNSDEISKILSLPLSDVNSLFL